VLGSWPCQRQWHSAGRTRATRSAGRCRSGCPARTPTAPCATSRGPRWTSPRSSPRCAPSTPASAPHRLPGTRGGLLAERDDGVRQAAAAELSDRIDGAAALRSWEQSLAGRVWDSADGRVHGDLLPGNLLVAEGCLSAILDYGGLNLGDPACDLKLAWNLSSGDSRRTLLAELEADDVPRLRARGWALSRALMALPYC
jgi:aminoglycoside phosphotransferase (APT) family kinase protein